MTTHTLILWFLTLVALSTSISALFVAFRTSGRYLSRQLSALSELSKELHENQENLTQQLRNIRSRLNMQAYRKRKLATDGDEPASDEELPLAGPRPSGDRESQLEWKRKMNLQLALRGGPK